MNRGRRRFLAAAAAALMTSRPGFGSPKEGLPVGGGLPPLDGATAWINSEPLTTASLRRRVVLVDFCTYTCINWLRTLPWIRAWAEKYRAHGLTVVGVHTPEFPFERDLQNVRRAIERLNVPYPIAVDNNYTIWRAFDNEYWPALYAIDAKGQTRHHRFGEGEYDRSEAAIQGLLREAGARDVPEDLVSVSPQGIEAPASWRNLQSEENYLGRERTQHFVSAGAGRLPLNHWALSGRWTVGKQAVALNEAGGRIVYRFHARDLHLVMRPAPRQTAIPFRVWLDGQPPVDSHGGDVDAEGSGVLREPRLYQLIRQVGPVLDRQFEIEFAEAGAEAFSFTFG